jgi:hypothetical protein
MTSTPYNTPTQVRTDRPELTGTPSTISQTPTPDLTELAELESLSKTPEIEVFTPSPTLTPTEIGPVNEPTENGEPGFESPEETEIHWSFLLIGMGSGLGMLGLTSYFLSKTYLDQ